MVRFAALVFSLVFGATAAWADAPLVWIAVQGAGKAEIRAVVPGGQGCPVAKVDGSRVPLVAGVAADKAFPVLSCHALLPRGAKDIAVEGVTLKPPAAQVNRIVVFGDTGCRLKAGADFQACNDPVRWPFASIIAHALAEAPDLVIDVGDYHYREAPCPNGNEGCKGAVWGYNWSAWDADFFTPARPLLAAAPWVMERGNHEDCRRAGVGWSRLLSPAPTAPGQSANYCSPADAPYRVDLGGLSLVVIDDSDAPDGAVDPAIATRLSRDLAVQAPVSQPWWLLTHHPVHGVYNVTKDKAEGANPSSAQALYTVPPGQSQGLQLLLSGHIHALQVINYDGGHPPLLLVGTGGDALEKHAFADLSGVVTGGWTIHDGFSEPDFGYVVMERDGSDWRITGHRPDGTAAKQCLLHAGAINCP